MTRYIYTAHGGYERLREPGDKGKEARMYHHRLAAYAWGLIDSIDADAEVHHRIECAFLNTEGNLTATTTGEHARITRQRHENRTQNPEGEHPAVNEVFSA